MSVFSSKAPPGARGRNSSAPRRTTRDRAPVHPMAALNHHVGNSTLQRWMAASGIQAKLHVTEPNDRHEKEADNVANKVMRSPADTKPVDEPISRVGGGAPAQRLTGTTLLHHPEPMDQTHEGSPIIQREPEAQVQAKSEDEPIQKADETVQSKSNEEPIQKEDEPVQSKAAAARPPAIPAGFATGLSASRGEGRPLPSESRSFFEKRIGANFSSVRIHADQRGADLSRSV